MNSITKHFALPLLLLTVFSCDETNITNNYTGTGEEKTYSIEGYAQKGPFIVGSNVTVSELNEDLYPTGRVFFATILDDEGHFDIPGVILVSPYIQIKVDGSYFTETQGGVPTGESLTLYSIADIRRSETINVNILTHLEKERVEYLVQQESKSFSDAKELALEELLAVFNLDEYDVSASEELSMLNENEGNAVLLTVSSIVEGLYQYERKLTFITNFQNDFKDGTLDDTVLQNTLVTSAFCLNPNRITEHLTTRFPDSDVPDFEPVLEHFINNSEYTNYFADIFSDQPANRINLLDASESIVLDAGEDYVLFVELPQDVNVFVMVDIGVNYLSQEGSFSFGAFPWTTTNLSESCPVEFPNCRIFNNYTFNTNDSGVIEIPINTFSGSGHLIIHFDINIDSFASDEVSFGKEFTW